MDDDEYEYRPIGSLCIYLIVIYSCIKKTFMNLQRWWMMDFVSKLYQGGGGVFVYQFREAVEELQREY